MMRRMEARISSIDGSCVFGFAALIRFATARSRNGESPSSAVFHEESQRQADATPRSQETRRSRDLAGTFRSLAAVRRAHADPQALDLIEVFLGVVLGDVEPE